MLKIYKMTVHTVFHDWEIGYGPSLFHRYYYKALQLIELLRLGSVVKVAKTCLLMKTSLMDVDQAYTTGAS